MATSESELPNCEEDVHMLDLSELLNQVSKQLDGSYPTCKQTYEAAFLISQNNLVKKVTDDGILTKI